MSDIVNVTIALQGTQGPAGQVNDEFDSIQLTQVAAPTTAPSVAIGGAGNVSGTSGYHVTFVTAEGETDLGPASGSITPSNQQVELTSIPVGPSGVIARKIYRANIAQGEWPRLLATITNNTATTYTDNIATGSVTQLPFEANTTGAVIYNGVKPIMVADAAVTILGFNSGLRNSYKGSVFIGDNIGIAQTTGYWNVVVGSEALRNFTTGYENTAVGTRALQALTTGKYNSVLGFGAGLSLTTGFDNNLVGYGAGGLMNGTFNNLIGVSVLGNATSANNVQAVGYRAGTFLNNGTTPKTTAENSIYIGHLATSLANEATNEIVIGHTGAGLGSNSVVIGNTDTTLNRFFGTVRTNTFDAISTTAGQTGSYEFRRGGTNLRTGYLGSDSDDQITMFNLIGGGFNFFSSSPTANSVFNHPLTFDRISRTTFLTDNSMARFGSLEVQSFALSNGWIGENVFLNGSTFERRATGPGGLFYFRGSEGQFRFFGSGAAGSNPGGATQLKIMANGTFLVGPNVNNSEGGLDGATFGVLPTGEVQFQTNIWHRSNDDTQKRLFFQPSNSSYYGTANSHVFRNTSDTTVFEINSNGTAIASASASASASVRIPHGTAPSSPVNGDIWTTTAGLFVRINGATVGPLS